MMKVIFFGTPDFVIPIADSILKAPAFAPPIRRATAGKQNLKLVAVVTNPDRPVGRKQILTPSPIKSWALKQKIKVIDFDTVIRIAVSLKKLKPDLGVLAAYGKIIPQEIIDLFPKGILVIHSSLLPKYRGASPIQAAILNGDRQTGVSIIQMDEKMDHGPILGQFKEKIRPDDTAGTLTKRLFLKTAEILPVVLRHAELGSASVTRKKRILKKFQDDVEMEVFSPPKSQDHSLATYTKLLIKDDGFIEWKTLVPQSNALRGYNFIRAMTPWPGAWTMVSCRSRESGNPDPYLREDDKILRLKILKAHLEPMLNTQYQIPDTKLVLDLVQLEGKKPVAWGQFQKAYPQFSFVKSG